MVQLHLKKLNMELVLVWGFFSLLVGFFSTDKSIGFWGGFLLSLFFSPLIGFIIAIFSSNKRSKAIPKYIQFQKDAERLENRGDIEEAIKTYKDVVFELKSAPSMGTGNVKLARMSSLEKAEKAIERLSGNKAIESTKPI